MTKENISISENEPENSKSIHSTNNGISKSIISNPLGRVGKAIAALTGMGLGPAAVPLPGGILVGAVLSLLKQNNNNKSIGKPNSAAMDSQPKP